MAEVEALRQGFTRFHRTYFQDNKTLFERLAREGQQPHTLMIACSDSRADPLLITDSKPGDLFVIRNVANLVPPCERDGAFHGTSAAIEFAVCNLKVRNIIVMGHTSCGGIRALVENGGDGITEGGFIGPWVSQLRKARDRVVARLPEASTEQLQRECERAGVILSLENLMTFPFVNERVTSGDLRLFGWLFDIESGVLYEHDPAGDSGPQFR